MDRKDAKDMVEALARESDRKKTSIYISERVWKDFKKACKTATPSNVLERLMKDFIEKTK